MLLQLEREPSTKKSTSGRLFVDGSFICYTLEDVIRDVKVYGETAIPAGEYEVRLSHSPRFQKVLPEVLEVPNFVGIRIHAGNTAEDSHGCILVGSEQQKDKVLNSRVTLEKLMSILEKATDKITLVIQNAVEAT